MNVQQTILTGIKQQLFFNDYLVLPGFGGFVLKHKPAHFSASRGMLLPSGKSISFNAQLKQNDGILTLWLQSQLSCKAEEAMQHLTDFSEFCSGVLQAKRRLTLNGIGFFYLDFENNICFEPQADANFMRDSFGLAPISIKELAAAETVTPKKESVFADRVLAQMPTSANEKQTAKHKRNYVKLVTPLLLALLLVGVTSLLVINTRISGELKSTLFNSGTKQNFNPLNYPELKLITSIEKNNTYVADANGIATVELDEKKSVAAAILSEKTPDVLVPEKSNAVRKNIGAESFEIVMGCFSILDNANRMVSNLAAKHIDAYVSGNNHKGMHVVSVGSFSSKEEAVSKLNAIKINFPHAWIKKP